VDTAHVRLYKEACDGGHKAGCVAYHRSACDDGNETNCLRLGELYDSDDDAPFNWDEAVEPYRRACEKGGIAKACNNLARMYTNGRGVKKNEAEALSFYQKACKCGSEEGCAAYFEYTCNVTGNLDDCHKLGSLYDAGGGVTQDKSKASVLYRKSCDGGIADGCFGLAALYTNGKGVKKDEATASKLYGKACDGGIAKACNNLGLMYANGQGVMKDNAKALALYRKACAADANSCDLMCQSIPHLTDPRCRKRKERALLGSIDDYQRRETQRIQSQTMGSEGVRRQHMRNRRH
jgi:TPR repeat protein